ncbi:MAG: chromosomal replication initiator protein DnaA [Paludibacteraceae bacterium]|nr:chromosomal replication initiator protein DnaA [Paludibacteraceae bacterium]
MHEQVLEKWQECQRILADNLTASAYQTWFAPIVPLQYEGGVLVLQVKSQFVAEYIEENYIQLLSRAIIRVFGAGTQLEYRVLIDSASGAGPTIPSSGATKQNILKQMGNAFQPQVRRTDNFETQLNQLYTFESFVAGEPNKLARTAGIAIAKQPGYTAFNPLFIYGGSGVGKTHLANAIGNQVALLFPHARVLYVTANTFKLQFQDAHNLNRIPDFLNFYQSVDVLIMDDVQYFSGLKGSQDTFFHIFDYLHRSRKQLILTCDRSPMELKDIQERLLNRFKWGLAAEISRPDYQLRRDILVSKMHRDGVQMPEEVIDFIATNVTESVRDLEGVLASLLAHATLTNREIDMALAEKVVSRIVRIQPKSTQLNAVIKAVAEHFDVTEDNIIGKARSQHIVIARHVAMYLGKELTNSSYAEVGSYFGERTHATALHSANYIRSQIVCDPVLRQHVQQIRATLQR